MWAGRAVIACISELFHWHIVADHFPTPDAWNASLGLLRTVVDASYGVGGYLSGGEAWELTFREALDYLHCD